MRKLFSLLVAFALVLSFFHQPQGAKAATPIRIFIDGQILKTDQPPLLIGGYTMVPLRGIFEALNAQVYWNQKAKTVTAKKRDTTIVLTIGARTATINNQTVTLDSPARVLGGRTMVPVRFVSESLGDDVRWDKLSQSVLITTQSVKEVGPVAQLGVTTATQYGDGRDLEVSFAPPSDQSNVSGYRILVVKAEKASAFNLAQALSVRSANYTSVSKSGSFHRVKLTAQSRDVDGALLRANQSYRAFVLTVGQDTNALSGASVTFTLKADPSVSAAANVKIEDISDFGDGRDLRVTFSKPSNESNITGYRVMIVKTANASGFQLAQASGVSSSYYTNVSATSGTGTLSVTLSSSARDTSGDLIRNGVAYTAFVMAVSSNTANWKHSLSSGSPSVTLKDSGVHAVTNLSVSDVADYNSGRDLQVSFTKPSSESLIRNYRVFVVKEAKAGSFGLTAANAVTNSNHYTTISKTSSGSSIVQTLSANARDVDGAAIRNGVAYRVFVLSVGTANGNNALSSPSNSIVLSPNNVTAVTNVTASDVSDHNNGQDLRVSFTKAANENNIAHYRAYVVKENAAPYFNLVTANAVQNYTVIYKTGANINQTLNADSRDIDGALIQNGVKYKVFILSVGVSNAYGNALSAASPTLQLENKGMVTAVTNVTASDVADNGNGQDLNVSFTRASVETNISHYRIFVVPEAAAYQFNLNQANTILNPALYTTVNIGSNYSQALASSAVDIFNQPIRNNVPYRIYVLSVGIGPSYGVNALSAASPTITLTSNTVPAASGVSAADVGDAGNGSDLQVIFGRAGDETNLSHYRVFVVKEAHAAGFQLSTANATSAPSLYTVVAKNGGAQYSLRLAANAVDVNGEPIRNGVGYRVFVLSVANSGANALSQASNPLTLASAAAPAPVVSGIAAAHDGAGNITVSYAVPAGEPGISQYAVFVVKATTPWSEAQAISSYVNNAGNFVVAGRSQGVVALNLSNKSADGALLTYGETYAVYVLSVADGVAANAHRLSGPSPYFLLAAGTPSTT
ncbi:stalk domain-containing protein [Cohnella hongkongensis]|uniref:Stalk domain-containing protein n=1 Tax=Cohnella hongkongensis TaxID=178337 RepID=A0ABV9FG22_9BACL